MKKDCVVNLEKVPVDILGKVAVPANVVLDQEQLQTAKEVLNLFAESGYSVYEAREILEFCNDFLLHSPVGIYVVGEKK